jgi:hypothetical protein
MNNTINLLPHGGEIYYFPDFFTLGESDNYYQALYNEIPWQHDDIVVFGKSINNLA